MEKYFAEPDKDGNIIKMHIKAARGDAPISSFIPAHCVRITDEQRQAILRNPMAYKIRDKEVIESVVTPTFSAESRILEARMEARTAITEIEYAGYQYVLTEVAQRNIILGYIALQADKSSCRLWCKRNNEWEFKDHGKKELAALAGLITAKREEASEQLDAQIKEILS